MNWILANTCGTFKYTVFKYTLYIEIQAIQSVLNLCFNVILLKKLNPHPFSPDLIFVSKPLSPSFFPSLTFSLLSSGKPVDQLTSGEVTLLWRRRFSKLSMSRAGTQCPVPWPPFWISSSPKWRFVCSSVSPGKVFASFLTVLIMLSSQHEHTKCRSIRAYHCSQFLPGTHAWQDP